MSASTLSMTYHELNSQIGRFLGYGSTPADWAVDGRQEDIDQCRRMGYRRFLFPTVTSREKVAYEWSFLSPIYQMTLTEGVEEFNLPDDFGSLSGFITHDTEYCYTPMEIVGEWNIRGMRNEDRRGLPIRAAVVPATGNSWRLTIYPIPDTDYIVSVPYKRIPNDLTSVNPYPLGGVTHGQTILYGCLAEAERLRDDEYGVHNEAFLERLTASIEMDKKLRTPDVIGYNGDNSDDRGRRVIKDDITITNEGTIV